MEECSGGGSGGDGDVFLRSGQAGPHSGHRNSLH